MMAGEMLSALRALTAGTEDLGLIPSTHTKAHNYKPLPGDPMPSKGTDLHSGKTPIHRCGKLAWHQC